MYQGNTQKIISVKINKKLSTCMCKNYEKFGYIKNLTQFIKLMTYFDALAVTKQSFKFAAQQKSSPQEIGF